jgi:PIN domain nuclease of toxin-antitoxin system
VKVLLDTHVFIWRAIEPSRVSDRANRAIDDPRNDVLVSAVSAWEISTKHRIGKLESGAALMSGFSESIRVLRGTPLAIAVEHGLAAGAFDPVHRDPFDRVLAAQAMIEGAMLVTTDPAFESFPVTVLW